MLPYLEKEAEKRPALQRFNSVPAPVVEEKKESVLDEETVIMNEPPVEKKSFDEKTDEKKAVDEDNHQHSFENDFLDDDYEWVQEFGR